jgi:predicted SprT family Zn-dependent metalloprotease
VSAPSQKLEPLPYHVECREYLKYHEVDLWSWFASAQAKADYTEHLRLELLKATYRLEPANHSDLYALVDEARAKLQLDIPVTLYQAQNNPNLNASLFYMPAEGHVVFSGPMLTLLNPDEIKSVIGHELAHFHLWQADGGDFHIADRLLEAAANDPRASACHEQTARRYRLYTEVFADRGSLVVVGDTGPVVASLVKMQTGLSNVSAEAYLNQSEEIFSKGDVATEGLSHPEAFIRARALALWQGGGPDANERVAGMLEGAGGFDDLDLPGQVRLAEKTRKMLEHFLQPKWLQTPPVLGHASLFFKDFRPAKARDESLLENFKLNGDKKLKEYFCYVLLDFVTADPELAEMPLAAALELSRKLEFDEQFEKLAAKELKMKVRDLRRIKEEAAELLVKAEAQND